MILAAKFAASILCKTNKAWFVQMLSVYNVLCDAIARDRLRAGARKPRLSVQCSVSQCVSCCVWLNCYSS